MWVNNFRMIHLLSLVFGLPIMKIVMLLLRQLVTQFKWEAQDFSRGKQLFLRYRPIDLNKNLVCSRINNGQKYRALSEYSMDSWANGDKMYSFWPFTQVCLLWANQWIQKETDKIEEKLAWARSVMPLKIPCGEINRNCTLNDRCAYFCKKDSQFEDDELNTEWSDVKLHEFHFTAQ